jgi:predicted RNA-binding protein with PUA-like domain
LSRSRSYWLVKSEPSKYSWDDLVRDGSTYWDGVRNALARDNLQAMRRDDRVLYYHSNEGKEVVGEAKVTKTAYPDPTSDDPRWVVVEDAALRDIPLVRQSRLSVMPLPRAAFDHILALSKKSGSG